jgi:predicted RNA-binding Zn-ribbon protein involved in translation (DUF1610 family)
MFETSDLITYSCPRCGSRRTTRLAEGEGPCPKISCHHCGYEGSPFATVPEGELIQDELSGSWWTCPNCGHHNYTTKSSYESEYDYEDWGITTVLVCTCCGYKV